VIMRTGLTREETLGVLESTATHIVAAMTPEERSAWLGPYDGTDAGEWDVRELTDGGHP